MSQVHLTAILINATARSEWVKQVVADAELRGADGVTLDIEGNNEHADMLTALVAELRTALRQRNPHAQLFCTQAMPAIANLSCREPLRQCLAKSHGRSLGYGYVGLAQHLDFFVRNRMPRVSFARRSVNT